MPDTAGPWIIQANVPDRAGPRITQANVPGHTHHLGTRHTKLDQVAPDFSPVGN